MSLTIIFVLIFLGLFLIFLEVIFIPGATVVGIIGGLLMLVGIFFVYQKYGTTVGNYTLAASVIANVILMIIGFKFVTSNKMTLQTSIDSKVNILEPKVKVGEEGVAFTALRPNGKAIFNNERIEVYSIGEFLDKDTKIEVVKIADNKIFVKSKT